EGLRRYPRRLVRSVRARAEPHRRLRLSIHAAEAAQGLQRIGFEIASQVIWDKSLFAMSRGWFHWGHEPCWVVRKPGVPNLFIGSRDQSTVWRAPSPKMIMAGSTEEKFDHPAQKPVLLFETPIRN